MLRGFKGGVMDLGDQAITFDLPTDIFDQSHYFLARGAGYSRGNDGSQTLFFRWSDRQRIFRPFPQCRDHRYRHRGPLLRNKAFRTMEILFPQRLLLPPDNHPVRAMVRRKTIRTRPFSAGIGNNQPYGSISFDHIGKHLTAEASYARSEIISGACSRNTPKFPSPTAKMFASNFAPGRICA